MISRYNEPIFWALRIFVSRPPVPSHRNHPPYVRLDLFESVYTYELILSMIPLLPVYRTVPYMTLMIPTNDSHNINPNYQHNSRPHTISREWDFIQVMQISPFQDPAISIVSWAASSSMPKRPVIELWGLPMNNDLPSMPPNCGPHQES